ncbi:MAG: hypothetical protein GX913_00805 [Clostridiales bacterium]|nr:hypothetical protein [Clostridiales bacterium]
MKEKIAFHWMENRQQSGYVTWGAPWKKGTIEEEDSFVLKNETGKEIPVQSKATAYWQDGSIKWTSHTANAEGESFILEKKDSEISIKGIEVKEDKENIYVNAGTTTACFPKQGTKIITNLIIAGRKSASSGELICSLEKRSNEGGDLIRREVPFIGEIKKVEVEDFGALKCVIKIEGIHKNNEAEREILPFILRFTLHYNSGAVGVTHTFLYDGQAAKDFIKSIGIKFSCPIEGEYYNRHVKVAGDYGYFHEALQLMSSWRPRIDTDIYKRQMAGEFLFFDEGKDDNVFEAVKDMTVWDSFRYYQDSPSHFSIKKRTGKENCAFIDSIHGKRGKGFIYATGETGGIGIGMKDFWQKYPSSLWIENMSKEEAEITAYIWSPEAEAMDLRHYDTVAHSSAYYEGFDEVGSTPYGIANTNELTLFGFDGKVAKDTELKECEKQVQKAGVLLATPEYYHSVKAIGDWSLVEKDTPLKKWLEEQLDIAFDFYKKEIDQRNWYGLFNYGDVMHSYDAARHGWKYDMGGYAWQNTELVPTLWLWFAFMRSGREDIYTVAEAMSRHCSEVDTYHLGEYKGIGSRHNVLHWGDSCKEPRIAMAGHHRAYYYLSGGDYRMGDVFEDVKDGDFSTLNIDPLRFFYNKEDMKMPTHARSGPDWSSYCSNWMTQWEMNQDEHYRDKILIGIEDIKKAPLRLVSGSNYEYDPVTGHLGYIGENASGGSHLAICMGGPQTWFEIADMIEDPEFTEMIAEYGEFYFMSAEEKIEKSGGLINGKGWSYPYMAAGIVAYAAKYYKSKELGYKVWQVLIHSLAGENKDDAFKIEQVKNYFNAESLDEMFWISTNFTAQWCLNTIVALELTKDFIPEKIEDVKWEDWVK